MPLVAVRFRPLRDDAASPSPRVHLRNDNLVLLEPNAASRQETTMSKLTATIAATVLMTTCSMAQAACPDRISVQSPGHQSVTFASDGVTPAQVKASYNAAFAAGRAEAIAAWQNRTKVRCPGHSARFYRATSRQIEACDQAMGGRFAVCVSGKPARKIFRF